MIARRRRIHWLALSLAALAAAPACGDDSGGEGAGLPASASSTTTAAASTSMAASTSTTASASTSSAGGGGIGGSGMGGSLRFVENGPGAHDYGHQLTIPSDFGEGEVTLEIWLRPDDSFPTGQTTPDSAAQLTNWSDADEAPYGDSDWWYSGNFLLDGHNNGAFSEGTFSLQWYGGGRVRWLFGDGADPGPGGIWSVGAYPATATPSLLDGGWHQITLVRRFVGPSVSILELWIDGALVDEETTPSRTDMRAYWDDWQGYPSGQEGWFWGAEKQAAIGVLDQYEDYKGLVAELRFWSVARDAATIASQWAEPVTGSEPGLVGLYRFDEGGGAQACDALDTNACIDLYLVERSAWQAEGPPL